MTGSASNPGSGEQADVRPHVEGREGADPRSDDASAGPGRAAAQPLRQARDSQAGEEDPGAALDQPRVEPIHPPASPGH